MMTEDSNATRTEDAGRTLIWEYPLAEALKQPFAMHFKAKVPIPEWVKMSSLVAGLASLVGITWFVRKRKISA